MAKSKSMWAGTAAVAALTLGGIAAWNVAGQALAAGEAPATAKRVENFRLASADLQSYELYRMADAPAVVILTQQNGCKASQASAAALQGLKAQYGAKGVEFLMLNSSLTTPARRSPPRPKSAATSPILRDTNQLVGESLGVNAPGRPSSSTPRPGRSSIAARWTPSRARRRWTRVIAGKPSRSPAGRPRAARSTSRSAPSRRLRQDLLRQGRRADPRGEVRRLPPAGRHRAVAMNSYEVVKGFAPMIREVVRTDRMPPYQADPHVGHFKQRQAPDRRRRPRPWSTGSKPARRAARASTRWPGQARRAGVAAGQAGPGRRLPAFKIPATGVVDYQRPWIANPLTEGRWLRASTDQAGRPPGRAPHPHRLHGGPGQGRRRRPIEQLGRLGRLLRRGAEPRSTPTTSALMPAGGGDRLPDALHPLRQGRRPTRPRSALYFYTKARPPKYDHAPRP